MCIGIGCRFLGTPSVLRIFPGFWAVFRILERAGSGVDFVERLDSCRRAEKTPAGSDVGSRKLTGASLGEVFEVLCRVGRF